MTSVCIPFERPDDACGVQTAAASAQEALGASGAAATLTDALAAANFTDVSVEAVTDTTPPTVSTAAGLMPSLLLGLAGVVAGCFATKA